MRPARFEPTNTADLARRYAFATVALAEGAGGATAKPVQLLGWGINAPVDGRSPVVVDDAFAAGLERNFAARTVEYPIDYNHASLLGFTDAPAAGWIAGLTVVRPGQETAGRAPGVWLVPDWTPEGRRRITAREYRYMSAVLRRDANGGGVLPELVGAALTNSPAIHGLDVVAASARPASLPVASPARFEAVDVGGGQLACSCPCGWGAVCAPIAGGFAVIVTDRGGRHDFTRRENAEAAVNECAAQHRERCPRSGAWQ